MAATMNQSWEYLQNASLFKAVDTAYQASAMGIFFWPIIFLFTLFVIYIKTENPGYVAIYAILGNVALVTLLPIATHPIFYTTVVLSIALSLWSFYGSSKIDA